jgi:hypothetical protein
MLDHLETLDPPPVVRRRRRSPWLRLLRAVAAVVLVGSLSFGMVAMDSHQAEATAGLLLAPALAGAAEGALPLAAWLGAVTPAGWVILGGVALAAGLYATKDYWLPYVQGTFGQGKEDGPSQVGGTGTGFGTVNSNFTLGGVTVSGTQLTLAGVYACPSSCTVNLHVAYRLQCKEPSGTVKDFADVFNFSNKALTSTNTALNVTLTCQYTVGGTPISGTPIALEAGVAGDGNLPPLETGDKPAGPATHKYWGLFKKDGFDPASPDTTYTASVECIRPDGTKFTLTADTAGDQKAIKMPSCEAASPGSHGTGKTTVVGKPPAVSGQPSQTLYTTPGITGTPYPKCEPGIPGNGCVLSVSVDGKPCVMGDWQCAHWADLKTEAPARLQCNYGPYLGIAIDTCNPLERAYETGGVVANEPNTDGNPSTRSDTDPAGNTVPKSATSPQTATGTGTAPGGAGVTAPAGSTTEQAECFPNGWAALNPVEWVLKPLGCAFVPKTNLQARVQNTVNTAALLPPMSWFNGVNMTAPGGAGCPNWTVHVAGFSENVVCESSFTAALRGSRNLVFTMLAAAMIWPLIRSLWYAAIPFIRVSPASGK